MAKVPNVAVMLAGCGHLDGAEVREAVLALLALDQHGATFQCIAPDDWQHHVIDHRIGQPAEGERRVLRGGAYNSILYNVGACFREGAVITDRGDTYGFRVVRDAAPD